MKRLLLLLLCMSAAVNAQIVDLEPGFKEVLLYASETNEIAKNLEGDFFKVDANDDGDIQVSEALNVSYLNMNYIPFLTLTLAGIEAFTNLTELRVSDSELEELNLNQNINLEILHLQNHSDLISLDINGCVNLQSLYMEEFYDLTNLDVSQNVNLEIITLIEMYNVSNLDFSQNINLESLTLIDNFNLSNLDITQSSNLHTLYLEQNDIVNLDVSQNINLQTLHIEYTDLTSLDVTQNVNLETLTLNYQYAINTLDLSQNLQLRHLKCLDLSLNSLDVSQNVLLERVHCVGNADITNLDFSKNINLQELIISGYYLDTMNIKNGSSEQLYLGYWVNLSVLCADEADIPYLQTFSEFENTEITSYCSFSQAGANNNISGNVVFDSDNDGCDNSDVLIPNQVRIDISDGSDEGSVYSDSSGYYNVSAQEGDFTLTPHIENENWFIISPSSVDIQFLDNNDNVATQDFCVTANGIHNDVEIVINPIIPAQPGFNAVYQIVYRNKGNHTVSGQIELTYEDAILDYVSSSMSIDSQSEGSLIWNYSDLLPFETRDFAVTFNVNSPQETPTVNIGDQLYFQATIEPISGDEIPEDNYFKLYQIVIGSYDPNDITCLEGDVIDPVMIGEYLHYNIRFENTGTAAATFVVVTNDIDETQFDLNTLHIMHASHDMMTRITDNKIEFIFDNINLEPEAMGNVVYKIKSRDNLNIGDSVSQQANIFFDYNFPIETNMATTTFQEPLSVNEFTHNTVSVYPNPTSGQVFIDSLYPIESVELYDIQGRKVQEFTISEEQAIDLTNTSKGIYFLRIQTDKGTEIEKLIKR